ncbi:MAG: peptidyl-prolyl cis-trans isomerase [Pirellulales bacterium]|nr:peptidyl-prolyl cis-trans isomerase [Pirellulales bacterium]
MVEIETSEGKIVLELNAEKAPKTVANFVQYVKSGHYEGTIFHRVISQFMIQGGGFDKDLKEKDTKPPVRNEAGNGLKNDKYTVAMARRTRDPHSATAQFFINTKKNDFLNRDQARDGYGYTVFGKVIRGMEVVDKIDRVPTGTRPHPKVAGLLMEDVPLSPVTIKSIKVVEPAKP